MHFIEIVQFVTASIILIGVQLKISTLFVVSHVLSAKMSPEWSLNQKKWPFLLNKGVPLIEVIGAKNMRVFFRDKILCPLNGGVP